MQLQIIEFIADEDGSWMRPKPIQKKMDINLPILKRFGMHPMAWIGFVRIQNHSHKR